MVLVRGLSEGSCKDQILEYLRTMKTNDRVLSSTQPPCASCSGIAKPREAQAVGAFSKMSLKKKNLLSAGWNESKDREAYSLESHCGREGP